MPLPNADALVEISKRTTGAQATGLKRIINGKSLMQMQSAIDHVPLADPYLHYAAQLVLSTHPDSEIAPERVRRYVAYGSSPRGLQALVRGAKAYALLDGRSAASDVDLRRAAKVALRHRTILNFEGEAEAINVEELLDEVISAVKSPAES